MRPSLARAAGGVVCASKPPAGRIAPAPAAARTFRNSRREAPEAKNRPSCRSGPRIQLNPIGAKISPGKLQAYVPVFEEHSVDHDLLAEGARTLTNYFESKGYFDAQVQFKEQQVVNDK